MLPFSQIHFQRIGHYFQVFVVAKEICIVRINKNGFYIVLFNVVGIGFLYVEQVFIANRLFVTAVAFFYVLLQFVDGRMQIDKYIGLYQLLVNDLKQSAGTNETLLRAGSLLQTTNIC